MFEIISPYYIPASNISTLPTCVDCVFCCVGVGCYAVSFVICFCCLCFGYDTLAFTSLSAVLPLRWRGWVFPFLSTPEFSSTPCNSAVGWLLLVPWGDTPSYLFFFLDLFPSTVIEGSCEKGCFLIAFPVSLFEWSSKHYLLEALPSFNHLKWGCGIWANGRSIGRVTPDQWEAPGFQMEQSLY